jgi:hypothetical protein
VGSLSPRQPPKRRDFFLVCDMDNLLNCNEGRSGCSFIASTPYIWRVRARMFVFLSLSCPDH